MPLTAPPDHTKTAVVAAAGLTLVLFTLVYSRSTLPQVGDNIHSLPHGGYYKDGTKQVIYGSPNRLNSLERAVNLKFQPWAYVLCLIALIYIVGLFERRGVCSCGRVHA
ncbi:triple gene block 2 protein [Phlox virus S]|uniref:Movement protein TGB2 n=1 Tax=Phlox virus S TaxID=436066 RepID=A4ZWC7_9VIRU|nr:triple gene block 2 protein [Phlox virus S]ABP37858.1 triple gene block 2 protein [Phlox virus S]